MDNVTLKKKLSTFLSDAGRLRNVSEEVLFELISTWEEWPGTAKDFYKSIGFSHRQIAKLLGKAKELKREGYFGKETFKEIVIENADPSSNNAPKNNCGNLIELAWKDKTIRFPKVTQLMEFIKKAS